MDRTLFIGCCLLGVVPGMVGFFVIGAKRRSDIPPLAWWLCLIAGFVALMYGLTHATTPSLATPITAIGKAYDHVEIRQGRDTHYGFRFVPDGGKSIKIETLIILPDWAHPASFNGRTLRIRYLEGGNLGLKNEAIDIAILSGEHAGFHDSLDARPVGKWLWIPIGATICVFGLAGLKYMKSDAEFSASSDDSEALGA
jgi:hypothetical protein